MDVMVFALTTAAAALRVIAANRALGRNGSEGNTSAQSIIHQRITCDGAATGIDGCQLELWPRTLYAVIIVVLYMRVLQYLRYYRRAGVITIVIGHMMSDVAVFLVVQICFVLGFGFAFVVLEPHAQEAHSAFPAFLNTESPIWSPLWGMYGMINHDASTLDQVGRLQPGIWALPIMIWLFLFNSNIVLINLLIAMMSDTYAKVTSEGLLCWQFERAKLISEFKQKIPLPPPLNLCWLLLVTLPGKLIHLYSSARDEGVLEPPSGFVLITSQQDILRLQAREQEARKKAMKSQEMAEQQTLEACMNNLKSDISKLSIQTSSNMDALNVLRNEILLTQADASGSVPIRRARRRSSNLA